MKAMKKQEVAFIRDFVLDLFVKNVDSFFRCSLQCV
jgi:hypothetical protein